MNKRIISLFLVICMAISCMTVSYAQEDASDETEAMKATVSYFNIMNGDPDGNFRLSDNITRAEFSKVGVAASKYKDYVAPNAYISPFKDVKYTHWAAPYVKVALDNGIMAGYEDGSFRPDKNVTIEEVITVYMRLLGYTDEEFGVSWPYGQISAAKDIGLCDGVDIEVGNTATREDVLILSYNLLGTDLKGTNTDYISVYNHSMVEDVILLDANTTNAWTKNSDIFTTSGTYKAGEGFDFSYIGLEGDICVDTKNNRIVSFVPDEGSLEKHIVYKALASEVITYKDGKMANINMADIPKVYDETTTSNASSVLSKMEIGDVLYVKYDEDSSVDYMIYKSGVLEGPITIKSNNWANELKIDVNSSNITKNGNRIPAQDIAVDDIIYYSPELSVIMAYSNKVTGIYEKAIPNRDMPTSVFVSGVEYKLEGANAFNALSSSGDLKYGDAITLLMGKDGLVADALSATEVTDNVAIIGYLMATGQKTYQDANNNDYSSYYASILLADGSLAEYKTAKDYKNDVREICSVTFDGAYAKIKAGITGAEVSGKVDSKARKIGKINVSDDVNIIDLSAYEDTMNEPMKYKTLYLQRLDGTTLSSRNIVYAGYNEAGEIDTLILNNFTGDALEYGLVTKVNRDKDTSTISYNCMIDGNTFSASGRGLNVPPSGEGAKIVMNSNNTGIYRISTLYSIMSSDIASVSLSNIISGNGTVYTYADDVQVYKMTPATDGVYYTYARIPLTSLSNLSEDMSVNVYYDKKDAQGGRIRVIVVKEK